VKAGKVKGLDAEGTLADNAERIVRKRLGELYGFVPKALDPDEVETLHDMRIAAKRLRYLLELTGFCFGPDAAWAAKQAKALQDVLGEIHDCDVMLPRVTGHLRRLRAADVEAVLGAAGRAADLDPELTARAPGRSAYRGLEMLLIHLEARRALLFERFLTLWARLERQGLRDRVEQALTDRAAAA
jgi:CHAD domain